MVAAAEACEADEVAGAAALTRLAAVASAPADVYPAYDALPLEELASWEGRAWDWERGSWAAAAAR